jgi:hypothetical protein
MTDAEFIERVNTYWDGLHVHVVGDGAGFSWYRCASCGGPAGDREHVHYRSIDHTDDPISGECTVCIDCAYYIANGEVPHDLAGR